MGIDDKRLDALARMHDDATEARDKARESGSALMRAVRLILALDGTTGEDAIKLSPKTREQLLAARELYQANLPAANESRSPADPVDEYVESIRRATRKYEATGDHQHDGGPYPGDCIRCAILGCLPGGAR